MSSISNLHLGHRARVKQEFRENGLGHFHDHKIMEMLLFYSIPRNDTNELGHLLIERFGSISGVLDASPELIMETKGLGEESATLIKFVSDLIKRYMEDYSSVHNTIIDTESAKNYMAYKFVGKSVECIYLACLAANGKVVFCDKIVEGSPETVGLRPVDIVKASLRANAVRVILAHNHPHGISTPSSTDLRTTSVLKTELERVDVELFDHIIVAHDAVYSMRENGMIVGV